MSKRHPPRRILRWIGGIFAGLAAIIVILLIIANVALNTDTVAPGTVQKIATSKDGTVIAYEQCRTGGRCDGRVQRCTATFTSCIEGPAEERHELQHAQPTLLTKCLCGRDKRRARAARLPRLRPKGNSPAAVARVGES
jgi:hypothetical protein